MSNTTCDYGSTSEVIAANNEEAPSFAISDVLDNIGFGKFHYAICILGILSGIGDGADVMLLAILPMVLEKEWKIDKNQQSLLTSIVFIGMISSVAFLGYLTSKIGRKKIIIISTIMLNLASFISVVSKNIIMMLTSRFFVGFAYGGAWQFKTYITEYMPLNYRLVGLYIFTFGFVGGTFYTTLMAYLTVNALSWRIWLSLTMIPSLVFCLLSFFLYETPFYLLDKGRSGDAVQCLKKVADINKIDIPHDFKLIKTNTNNSSTLFSFFSKKNCITNLILIFNNITSGISYYGFILIINLILSSNEQIPDVSRNEEITNVDFTSILISTSFEIPGFIACLICSHCIGRKFTLIFFYGVLAILYSSLMFIESNLGKMIITCIIRLCNVMPSAHMFTYITELYPTETRSFALGFLAMFFRIGGILSPFLVRLFQENVFFILLCYAISSLLSTLFSFRLIETKHLPTQ